jgi:[ribosomal protein S5]-alanine N-acetyltransferase
MHIKTARLTIRPFQPEDWHAVLEYTSDGDVMNYLPEGILNEQDTIDFVNRNMHDQAEKFAVVLHDGEALIGHMVFHEWYGEKTYEIGWVFNRNYQNKGFATEAANALVKYAFERLNAHRVIATCQPENIPSYRVMEKIGMRREAHFRKCMPAHYGRGTGWWDEYFYAMLEEEWEQMTEHRINGEL